MGIDNHVQAFLGLGMLDGMAYSKKWRIVKVLAIFWVGACMPAVLFGGQGSQMGAFLQRPSYSQPILLPGKLLYAWAQDLDADIPGDVAYVDQIKALGDRFEHVGSRHSEDEQLLYPFLYGFIEGRIAGAYEHWSEDPNRRKIVKEIQSAWRNYRHSLKDMGLRVYGSNEAFLKRGDRLIDNLE